MKRRSFLKALAAGGVAALLGVQPTQLGDPDHCPKCGEEKPRRICPCCFNRAVAKHSKLLTKMFLSAPPSPFANMPFDG